jgi:hypothetical protein
LTARGVEDCPVVESSAVLALLIQATEYELDGKVGSIMQGHRNTTGLSGPPWWKVPKGAGVRIPRQVPGAPATMAPAGRGWEEKEREERVTLVLGLYERTADAN